MEKTERTEKTKYGKQIAFSAIFYNCREGVPAGEIGIPDTKDAHRNWVITPTAGHNSGGLTSFEIRYKKMSVTAEETETDIGGTIWFQDGGCTSASCKIEECNLPKSGYISARWVEDEDEEGYLTDNLEVWGSYEYKR